MFFLVFAVFCSALISLELAESRIFHAAPADTRPRTPIVSFCTILATDILHSSLFGDSLSLYDLWFRPWGVSRPLGLHGLPPSPHPSEGVGQQQQQVYRRQICFSIPKSLIHFCLNQIGGKEQHHSVLKTLEIVIRGNKALAFYPTNFRLFLGSLLLTKLVKLLLIKLQ